MQISLSCEQPQKVKWNEFANLINSLNIKLTINLACTSPESFSWWKREISKKTNNLSFIPWPLLKESQGYWFSSFIKKEHIDRLSRFKELNIRVDIEPPYSKSLFKWLSCFFKKGRNGHYLEKTLSQLPKYSISTFPLPKFILKRLGVPKAEYNYFLFPSIIPKLLRPFYLLYVKIFLSRYKKSYILGLTGSGKFKEITKNYKSEKELQRDLKWLKKNNIQEVAIYSLEGIMKRKEPKNWLKIIKKFQRKN
ncbi:MAG: hypothetical protein U9Q69_00280 [Nanoarchaeota archaeon]|nr:hypothetical protein [Nanoarchaeota archaeon]